MAFGFDGRAFLMEILWQDVILVCILSIVSSGVHLVYFGAINFSMLKYYLPYIGPLHFLAFWSFSLVASTALLLSVRLIPVAGNLLCWMFWGALTVPVQLYYSVMKKLPGTADLHSLSICSFGVTKGTILPLLSPLAVIKGLFPTLLVLVISLGSVRALARNLAVLEKALPAMAQVLLAFLALGVFLLYTWRPLGHQFAVDAMGYALNILRDYLQEKKYYRIPRHTYTYNGTARSKPLDNILLILDESVRGDYISINNSLLDTTPGLERYIQAYPENFLNYGVMLASGTYSFLPRNVLLTGVAEMPDTQLTSQTNPTLFQIAKGNGYRTLFLNLWGADLPDVVFRNEDIETVDELHAGFQEFSNDILLADFEAAKYLNERFRKEEGLFVFLMPRGIHSPYEEQYPDAPEYCHYLPRMKRGEWYSPQKRREHVNSFKNAVRYHVDGFFEALLGEEPESLRNCSVFWTSDHGQSLMEDGQLESHGSKYLEQALVPFLIFSTEPWLATRIRKPSEALGTLSHMNIYPTLCSLLERAEARSAGAYRSLFFPGEWTYPPLHYIGGGSLWKESPQKPISVNGRIILRSERYLY